MSFTECYKTHAEFRENVNFWARAINYLKTELNEEWFFNVCYYDDVEGLYTIVMRKANDFSIEKAIYAKYIAGDVKISLSPEF